VDDSRTRETRVVTGLHFIAQDLQLYHVLAPSGWMNDFFDWDELERWAAIYPCDRTLGAPAEADAEPHLRSPLAGAPSVSATADIRRSAIDGPGTLDTPLTEGTL
jgi:hypothetical protein